MVTRGDASDTVPSAGEDLSVFFRPYNWSFGEELYQNSEDFAIRSVAGAADSTVSAEPKFPHMHRFQAVTARWKSEAHCHNCSRWLFDDCDELEPNTWRWYECMASYECAYRLCLQCYRELSAAHTEAVAVRIPSYPGVGDCELGSVIVRAAILQALTPLLLEPIARIVADFLEAGIRFCSPFCTQPDACEACVRPFYAPVQSNSALPDVLVLASSIRGFEHLSDSFSIALTGWKKKSPKPPLYDGAQFPALGSADWKCRIKLAIDEPDTTARGV